MQKKTHIPSFFRRFCARAVDYCLFYSLITGLLPLFDVYLEFYQEILLALFTPLLFFPIEAVIVYLFGTTIGNGLCQFKIINRDFSRISFANSLKRSFFSSIKASSIFYPFFAPLIEDPKKELKTIPISFSSSFSQFLIYLILTVTCLFGPQTIEHYTRPASLLSENASESFSSWKKYPIPELSAKVAFPGNPEISQIKLKLPKTSKSLSYNEYSFISAEDNLKFAISHTKLPKSILKWSSNLVLKGCLDIIKDNEKGAKIIKKDLVKIGGLTCLNYKMMKNGTIHHGRLLLIDDILYKLEVCYPKENAEHMETVTAYFLQSFSVS